MEKAIAEPRKIISVRVDPELRKLVRITSLELDTTVQDYIVNLIHQDLKKRGKEL